MRENGAQAVDRALALLLRIIDDGGRSSLGALSGDLGLAPATSYRLAGSLRRAGMIVATARGRFVPGPALARRHERLSLRAALAAVSRPILRSLASRARCVAHIGVLDGEMVTYLVREGTEAHAIHSQEGTQLEAYSSGIGKMLLAGVRADARDAYLASAPFVALTDRTITDPETLRTELAAIAARGFARDSGESSPDIHCLAVAIRDPAGSAVAALSLSRTGRELDEPLGLTLLNDARARLETAVFAPAPARRSDEPAAG